MRQLSQSVCMGVTLSLGWLGKPEPRSGGAVYILNRVRHSNQARPEVAVGPVVSENIISEILVSAPFQKYSTPMVHSEKICFRYLGYLMYLVPEVPVGPVVPANLISVG